MRNRVGNAIAEIAETAQRSLARMRGEETPEAQAEAKANESTGEIIFRSLDPVPPAAVSPFPKLNDEWIRRYTDPVSFQESLYYLHHHRVNVMEAGERRLIASVRGSVLYTQEIVVNLDQLNGRCSCQAPRGDPAGLAAGIPLSRSLCRHSVAALRAYLQVQTARPRTAEDITCVCPVTRKKLKPGSPIYQCRVCRLAYSPEGWDFLRQVDRGRCCGCRNKNTVVLLRPGL